MSTDCYIDIEGKLIKDGSPFEKTIRVGHAGLLMGAFTEFKTWDTLWYLSKVSSILNESCVDKIITVFECLEYSMMFTPGKDLEMLWEKDLKFREQWRSLKHDYVNPSVLKLELMAIVQACSFNETTWSTRVD